MAQSGYKEWYFDWMCRYVTYLPQEQCYDSLLRKLNDITYYATLRMDENRLADGISLRHEFAFRNGLDYATVDNDIQGPPSVLEVLLALAIRAEVYTASSEHEDWTHVWFWEMMTNMGLTDFTDDNFDELGVELICETFLERNYAPNGVGGPFAFETDKDIRDVELWWQMQWYQPKILHMNNQ